MYEWRLSLPDYEIKDERIKSLKIYRSAFDKFKVGSACSAQLKAEIYGMFGVSVGAKLALQKIDWEYQDGEKKYTSSLETVSIFYVNEISVSNGISEIVAFDPMIKTEVYVNDIISEEEWWKMISERADPNFYCSDLFVLLLSDEDRFGFVAGASTSSINLDQAIVLLYPGKFTVRECLAQFAAIGFGAFFISCKDGKETLEFAPFLDDNSFPYAISNQNVLSAYVGGTYSGFTGCRISLSGKSSMLVGSDTGSVLTGYYGFANSEPENDENESKLKDAFSVYDRLSEFSYTAFSIDGLFVDHETCAGNTFLNVIEIQGNRALICGEELVLTANKIVAYLYAPSEVEIEEEPSPEERALAIKTDDLSSGIKEEIGVEIDEVSDKVNDPDTGLDALLDIVKNRITLEVSETTGEGGKTASITLSVDGENRGRGQILIEGNVNISGELSADALYAAMGDIADLTVDRLCTSRRVKKYLAEDTTDDNYLNIAGEAIEFVSGLYAGSAEQARNPYGELIFWEDDPDSEGAYLGADGYPYKGGVRIFTTTEETPYPVMVYTYTDQVKTKFQFELEGTTEDGDPIYTPTLTLGAGNERDTNFATVRKATDGLEVMYKSNAEDEREVGIKGTVDGYLDFYGARRTTRLDFSDWQNGSFTEMVEGDGEVYEYAVEFDDSQRPTKITSWDGFETVITWESGE